MKEIGLIGNIKNAFHTFFGPSFIEKESAAISMGGKNNSPIGRWDSRSLGMDRYGFTQRSKTPDEPYVHGDRFAR